MRHTRAAVARAGGALIGLAMLVGCVPGEADPRANIDKPVASPSGSYTAVIERRDVAGIRYLAPVIRDRSGAVVYDKGRFAARHALSVLWQNDKDVLWAISGDVGTSKIVQDGQGWVMVDLAQGEQVPPEIQRYH